MRPRRQSHRDEVPQLAERLRGLRSPAPSLTAIARRARGGLASCLVRRPPGSTTPPRRRPVCNAIGYCHRSQEVKYDAADTSCLSWRGGCLAVRMRPKVADTSPWRNEPTCRVITALDRGHGCTVPLGG